MLRDGNRRASEGERKDAVRRLRAYGSLGHLEQGEVEERVERVQRSKTPDEIALVFKDLPALDGRPATAEPRISTEDKGAALDRLKRAHQEGRIDEGEHSEAMSLVTAARTPSELAAAFRGLPGPNRSEAATQAARQTAALTTRAVTEGGRRAKKAFLRFLFSVAALLIGIVLLVAGVGIAAVACFVLAVLLLVAAAVALVSRF